MYISSAVNSAPSYSTVNGSCQSRRQSGFSANTRSVAARWTTAKVHDVPSEGVQKRKVREAEFACVMCVPRARGRLLSCDLFVYTAAVMMDEDFVKIDRQIGGLT